MPDYLASKGSWDAEIAKEAEKLKMLKKVQSDPSSVSEVEGQLYNVNLNVDPNELLDWDAPLSEQSEKIRKIIAGDEELKYLTDTYGMDSLLIKSKSAEGSADLASRGILGIKYLDGFSRSAGEGTRNYVIFDDSLIDTKRVNDKLTDSWMNPEARMARADEMGFNRDIYHKTWGENFEGDNAFSSFDPQKMQQSDYGYAGKGVYATPKPLGGSAYGNVTMQLKTNIKNPYIRTADNFQDELDPYQWIPKNSERLGGNAEASAAWTKMMQSNGYDGFIDEAVENGETVIFDPKNIRSINAEFDPTKADSADLLSSVGATSALRGIV
jgi:hypothetical protein